MDIQKVYTQEEFQDTFKDHIELIKKNHVKEFYQILYKVKQINQNHSKEINDLKNICQQDKRLFQKKIQQKDTQIQKLNLLLSEIQDQLKSKSQKLQSVSKLYDLAHEKLKETQKQCQTLKIQLILLQKQIDQFKKQQSIQLHNIIKESFIKGLQEFQLKNKQIKTQNSITKQLQQKLSNKKNYDQLILEENSNNNELFITSKILSSKNQLEIIQSFFAPKTIKSVKLLYRASQNYFQVKKFHQKCDGIYDTLTLIETQFSKKIGGYTPIKWTSNNSIVMDDKMYHFIFSLTEGDKFQMTTKAQAVLHHHNYGPSFGGDNDLWICDKSNTKNLSGANINHTYKNDKYQYNNKDSWLKFSGSNSSYNFKTKQWQVWNVEFN